MLLHNPQSSSPNSSTLIANPLWYPLLSCLLYTYFLMFYVMSKTYVQYELNLLSLNIYI